VGQVLKKGGKALNPFLKKKGDRKTGTHFQSHRSLIGKKNPVEERPTGKVRRGKDELNSIEGGEERKPSDLQKRKL